MTEELALEELSSFINKWVRKPESKGNLKEAYPNTMDAILEGRLILDENKVPTLKLQEPLKNDEGGIFLSEVTFKTRIKPSTQADLGSGLDLSKNQAHYALRLISYISGQPIGVLDRLSGVDYDTISEISAFFMSGGR